LYGLADEGSDEAVRGNAVAKINRQKKNSLIGFGGFVALSLEDRETLWATSLLPVRVRTAEPCYGSLLLAKPPLTLGVTQMKTLKDAFARLRKSRSSSKKRRPANLAVESLEDRLVMSTTYTVTSLLDANPPSNVLTLREAILAANADHNQDANQPDVINFGVSGAINLASSLPAITGSLSILGPGAPTLTVMGTRFYAPMFNIAAGASLAVSSITVDGGDYDTGLSVGSGASLMLQNSVVQNCVNGTGSGGAIQNNAGTVAVSGSKLLGNFANNFGGAIANLDGSVTVSQSTLNNNEAILKAGGAIYNLGNGSAGSGQLTILDSTIANNISSDWGGGVAFDVGSQATIVASTFNQNQSYYGGGAISFRRQNNASTASAIDISGCTIAGNHATPFGLGGGGIYLDPSNSVSAVTTVVTDSIVAGNYLQSSQQTLNDVSGAFDPSSGFDLIGVGTGLSGISDNQGGNLIGTASNPINPKVGPLQDNGGPTWTMALLPGSPALDRGGPDAVGDQLTQTDQRGDQRQVEQPFALPSYNGDGREIGAYELALQNNPTILTVNTLQDGNAGSGMLTLRQAIQVANGSIPFASVPAGLGVGGSAYITQIQFAVTGTLQLVGALPAFSGTAVALSGPGESQLTVKGDSTYDTMFSLPAGSAAVFSGLTIDGNLADAALSVAEGASLSVSNTVLQNCVNGTGSGGAIASKGGLVSILDTQLVSNYANYYGGAIFSFDGTLSVAQSTFSNNLAIGNDGGAIYNRGIGADSGVLTISGSTFSSNQSTSWGGAVELDVGSQADIVNSTFFGNNSYFGGGAISVRHEGYPALPISLNVFSTTIDGNYAVPAGLGGGGLYVDPANSTYPIAVAMNNSIVAGNYLKGSTNTASDIAGALNPVSTSNLIGDGSGLNGIVNGVNGNQVGTDANPLNADLGPLQDNGGPAFTMALLPGSPALATGTATLAAAATDQRGFARIVNGQIDIGAFENQIAVTGASLATPPLLGATFTLPVASFLDGGPAAPTALIHWGDGTPDSTVTTVLSSAGQIVPDGMGGYTVLGSHAYNAAGAYTIAVTIQDSDGDFAAATPYAVTIAPMATTATVASSSPQAVYGQLLTITATVADSVGGAGVPQGTVNFLDGASVIGSGTLNSVGVATFITSALGLGNHVISAQYLGMNGYLASNSTSITQYVVKDASETKEAVSVLKPVFGQTETLTATVSAALPGSGTPRGTVTFRDNGTVLATVALNSAGQASFSTSALPIGRNAIVATYNGGADFTASTSSLLSVVVAKDATKATLVSSLNPAASGQPVTFTVVVSAVSPGSGIPSGTVTFYFDGSAIGTARLNSNGVATFTTAALPVGNDRIRAGYGGDQDFAYTSSPVLVERIEAASAIAIEALLAGPTNRHHLDFLFG
jgi:hypothetical protein